jgi:UDP-3-O-[3-hydroxymyristoyl] N-acetylglucosamine deacetylase
VPAPIRLEGFALHAGIITAVTLARHEGPITLVRHEKSASLDTLRVTRTDFGVAVTDDRGLEVDLVEHLLAAFGGLGVRHGVVAVVEGPELPILDGGARVFAEAIARLEIAESMPELVVARRGRLAFDESSYAFEPRDRVELEVEAIFDHPAIGTQHARWDGDRGSFGDRIAPARTFGFLSQAAELARRGRAGLATRPAARSDDDAAKSPAGEAPAKSHPSGCSTPSGVPQRLEAAPAEDESLAALREKALREAVLVFGESTQRGTGDEIARHKLLDLIGDLTLYGGPPLGRIVARRPGHTATHRIVRRALDCGILVRR